MTKFPLPASPKQAYVEATTDLTAYKVGVVLRIVWEVTKQILKWSALIAAAIAVGGVYFLWQLVFGTMKK